MYRYIHSLSCVMTSCRALQPHFSILCFNSVNRHLFPGIFLSCPPSLSLLSFPVPSFPSPLSPLPLNGPSNPAKELGERALLAPASPGCKVQIHFVALRAEKMCPVTANVIIFLLKIEADVIMSESTVCYQVVSYKIPCNYFFYILFQGWYTHGTTVHSSRSLLMDRSSCNEIITLHKVFRGTEKLLLYTTAV